MNSKGHKSTKPKVMDVTKAKKTSATTTGGSSQRVIIQSRPIINADPPTSGTSTPEPTTAPTLTASKKVIVPITSDDSDKPEALKQPAAKDESKEVAGQPAETPAGPPPTEPAEEAEETPAAPAADPEPAEEQESPAPASESSDDTESEDGNKKPSPETQKAVEEAAKAEAREREVQDYIEKHEFFVPINAVARKRSIKVSAGLTVLVLLLAVVLVDLMLDSGLILLVQKIPHTHFFTTSSTNK